MKEMQPKPFLSALGRIHRCSIVNQPPRKIINEIDYPVEPQVPMEFIKFYQISENSVDALLNNYLYAANTLLFNDPFDCPAQLWNLDLFSLENLQNKMDTKFFKETDPNNPLESRIHNRAVFFEFRMATLGVICLHEFSSDNNDCQDALWGYYTNQKGFAVKFDSNQLIASFGTAFQVEYLEKSQLDEFSLDNIKIEKGEDFLPVFLRWTTQKKKIWENEHEWRFVLQDLKAETLTMDAPDEERKRTYCKSAISEVLLGLKFFNTTNMVEVSEQTSYYIIDCNKQRHQYNLLAYLSFPSEIPVAHMYMKQDELNVFPRPCRIFNEGDGRFEIEYPEQKGG